MTTPEAYLAERYGTTTTPARRWVSRVALGVGALVALAVAVWVALVFANQPVRWDTIGYQVHDASRTDVTFDVIMAPGTVATCRVEALSESYAQVGVADVVVGPSQYRVTRFVESIPTAEEAVTALVDRCDLVED
jgi:hypothetical protein